MIREVEVVVVDADGITITQAEVDDVSGEYLLEWTNPAGDKCVFRLHHDIKQIWIEVGP